MRNSTFGPAYDKEIDGKIIEGQMGHIKNFMKDGSWWNLGYISHALHIPEASVSAQLRHLRKEQFGGYRVNKRRDPFGGRVWEYQVLPPLPKGQLKFL